MAFGSRLGISNHLIRRVTRHRSMATLFRATPPAAGPATPIARRALDPQTVVAAVPIPLPDNTLTGEPFPSPVPPDQELGAAILGPENERVATTQGPVQSMPHSAPARLTMPSLLPIAPLGSAPLPSGARSPVAQPSQVTPGEPTQALATPRTADESSAPLPPITPVESSDTSSAITDDVWRRLRTIFERHQTAGSSSPEGPPGPISQQANTPAPPFPLPGEVPPMESVPELPGGPPPERATEEVFPPAAPVFQPSRTDAADAGTPTTQIDARDLPATTGRNAAHPTPTAEADLVGQSRPLTPSLAPGLESFPQPLEQVWDVERIGMRPPEAHEPSEDTFSQTALSDMSPTRAVPAAVDTVIQARRPATQPVEALHQVPPSEAPPKVTSMNDQSPEARSESVRQLLDRVAAGGPTQSTIEVLSPRRPRPSAQRPTAPRASTATPATAPEPSMVQTAIGPLPSDLWGLIDEPVPGVARPAPRLEDREQSRSDGPAPAALTHPEPIPSGDSGGPPLPGPDQPSRHDGRAGEETRNTTGIADTTPVTQRRANEPAGDTSREPRVTTRAQTPEAHNGAVATAGAPLIQRTLAPVASTARPVTAPPSEVTGPSVSPADTGAQAPEGEAAPGIDVAELARRVYAEIKRRLSVERERSPWH